MTETLHRRIKRRMPESHSGNACRSAFDSTASTLEFSEELASPRQVLLMQHQVRDPLSEVLGHSHDFGRVRVDVYLDVVVAVRSGGLHVDTHSITPRSRRSALASRTGRNSSQSFVRCSVVNGGASARARSSHASDTSVMPTCLPARVIAM